MDFSLIFPVVIEWWPFVAVILILWYVGREVKKLMPDITTESSHLVVWYYKTLPFHPLVVGFLLGFIPGMPIPATINAYGAGAAHLYYTAAGVLSIVWHDIYMTMRKYKKPDSDE